MKKVYVFTALLLVTSAAVVAQIDIPAIKKSMQDDAAAVVKRMTDDAQKMADNFKLYDGMSEIVVKTYPKDDHESFRSAEEKKMLERITAQAKKLNDEMGAAVEQAFVDIMKKQQAFEDVCKQDIAAFKQQFSENIQKMAQGKSTTPITYSSAEGVAKSVEPDVKKVDTKKLDDVSEAAKLPDVVKKDAFSGPKDVIGLNPEPVLPPIKSSSDVKNDSDTPMGIQVKTSAAVPLPSKPEPKKPEASKSMTKDVDTKKTDKTAATNKSQKDLFKLIRG